MLALPAMTSCVALCSGAPRRATVLAGVAWAAAVALCLGGCGPDYPEVSAPLGPPPSGKALEPRPANVLYVGFTSATLPALTRDGRSWRSDPGSKPDPFAELLVNNKALFKTKVQSSTLHPTWPHQPKGNYEIPKGATVTVEVWDSETLKNYPICVRSVRDLRDRITNQQVQFSCDSGAQVVLRVEPAHARFGLGFWYQIRPKSVLITRVMKYSPAARDGLREGDKIVSIQGKAISSLRPAQVKGLINANAQRGVNVTIRHANGSTNDALLGDGPVYQLADEHKPVE